MESGIMMYSPTRLRELLEEQGRKHEWLADHTGYERETVTRYLTGAYPISEKFAQRAAKALGVPLHWLRDESAAPSEAVLA
jgi:transcriptional regulator with XRE-family HTH domain